MVGWIGAQRCRRGAIYASGVPLRVAVAEDSLLVREGVRLLLASEPDLAVCGVYRDADTLLAGVAAERPDVVLTDIRMPPTYTDEGIRAADRFAETAPGLGVVVLSQHLDPVYAVRLFARGSAGRGYLLKERLGDIAVLVNALREVAAGGSVVDPKVVDVLVRPRASSPLDRLSPREREVLALVAQAKTNAAIAAELVLTERAVEKHIGSIFTKLDVGGADSEHRRVRAVLTYLTEMGANR
jgi:DNA-binding NarL/FixJ family response regulator